MPQISCSLASVKTLDLFYFTAKHKILEFYSPQLEALHYLQDLRGSFKSVLRCVVHAREAKNLWHNTKQLLSATVKA